VSVYLDASALMSWYVPDDNNAQADAVLSGERQPTVSDLTLAEVANALIRRRKQGRLLPETVARVLAKMDAQVDTGRLLVEPLPRAVFIEARLLAERVSGHLRTSDALHLAMAKRLHLPVVTFDLVMRSSALADGIQVRPT
jgi:uncharacterized protein